MEILTTHTQKFKVFEHELVGISNEIDLLLGFHLRENVGVDGLLRQIGIREILRTGHYVNIDIVYEDVKPLLESRVYLIYVLIHTVKTLIRIDISTYRLFTSLVL